MHRRSLKWKVWRRFLFAEVAERIFMRTIFYERKFPCEHWRYLFRLASNSFHEEVFFLSFIFFHICIYDVSANISLASGSLLIALKVFTRCNFLFTTTIFLLHSLNIRHYENQTFSMWDTMWFISTSNVNGVSG